ncbi:protein DOWNY MILDEW RESISTANCE 6-like protein [Cinnamomum micranthum f. kanehirae]|uniref:Protein DOWNY MILDEW RESISTANCE 6-like protein n=1 Tax=Cinnamomum micranthum f. kanehirae TaxID=337451 RepID=A0A3S3NEP9_9MAGN|nr:protein DOWNY MILDEW RESISTANCE 6-like protein [Cinnamomum micranthum f. kanehirae]
MVSSPAMPILAGRMLPSSLSVLENDTNKDLKHMLDTVPEIQSIPPEFILPVEKRPSSVHQGWILVIELGGLDGSNSERMLNSEFELNLSANPPKTYFETEEGVITNHGVKQCLMKELIRVLEDFYSLPWEQKVKYVSDDVTSRPVRYGTSLYTTCATLAILWKVIYNTGQLILSVTAKLFLEEMRLLALNIAEAVSQGLGLERDHIEKAFGQGWQIMAANF